MTYRNLKLQMLVFAVVALSLGGCRSGKDLGGDSINPDALPGDIGLNQRFEDGIRIQSSEFNVSPILFAYDSFRIKPSDMPTIARVAGFMRSHRDVRLIVEGHCDERGSREYNVSLGEHRALAIRAALIGDQNISSKRIQTRSFGEEKPVDARHHEGAWGKNRRGEFALYR